MQHPIRHEIEPARRKKKSGPVTDAVMKARKRLLDWNKAPLVREQLSPRIQAEIRDMYSDDVALLETLIGRDLGHWLGRGVRTPS